MTPEVLKNSRSEEVIKTQYNNCIRNIFESRKTVHVTFVYNVN